MSSIQIILIVVAVIAMLESVWLLAAPASYKKFVVLWLRVSGRLPTLLPLALTAIGILLWLLVLAGQPIYRIIGVLLGAFFVLGAFLYSRREVMVRLTENMLLDRSPRVLRLLAVGVLLAAACVLWIAITGK